MIEDVITETLLQYGIAGVTLILGGVLIYRVATLVFKFVTGMTSAIQDLKLAIQELSTNSKAIASEQRQWAFEAKQHNMHLTTVDKRITETRSITTGIRDTQTEMFEELRQAVLHIAELKVKHDDLVAIAKSIQSSIQLHETNAVQRFQETRTLNHKIDSLNADYNKASHDLISLMGRVEIQLRNASVEKKRATGTAPVIKPPTQPLQPTTEPK